MRVELARLLKEANDPEQAHIHLKFAMGLAPDDNDVKVAYAENSVIMEQQRDLTVRGRRSTVHLYEVVAFKNPLDRCVTTASETPGRLEPKLDKLVTYPEDFHPARGVH